MIPRPIVLQNALVQVAVNRNLRQTIILVYDKLRFSLINRYTLNEFIDMQKEFLYFCPSKGQIRMIS